MVSRILRFAFLVGAVSLTGWSHARLPDRTRADLGGEFVPEPWVARTASLGFDALVADYYWLQAVQIVGSEEFVDEATASHLGRLIDVVTTVNPAVGHPYRFAAVWLHHSREQVVEANRLLERAIRHHPGDWRNHFYLGFNHFYYLGDFAAAADALEQSIGLAGAPDYLTRLVARLRSEEGDIDVAYLFLRQLLEQTEDEGEIAKIESALDEIEIEFKARHLDRAREAYRKLAGRDLERLEDLVSGPHRVLDRLPSPEPDALPASLRRGSSWELDEDGRIVSSYLGSRYEVHFGSRQGAVFASESAGTLDGTPPSTAEEGKHGG